ncbi:Ubiquitin carboxyl-terminal hydrolase 14 [Gonapodya sp. JEL0774]|nr:Ubiquitin carboxyl-terminal hydrolase 14 [Gonapodya sp. JEL0774]
MPVIKVSVKWSGKKVRYTVDPFLFIRSFKSLTAIYMRRPTQCCCTIAPLAESPKLLHDDPRPSCRDDIRRLSLVLHGDLQFDDVELDTDDSATTFKATLFSLTGVAPDRQKIMVKGGMLKDETNLNTLGLKPGHQFMMMGTAGELPKEPVKKAVFLEDMTGEELARAMDTPNGLVNLGNTCYMNSTLQTLRVIPELQEALTTPMTSNPRQNVAVSLKDLFKLLNTTPESVPPFVFLQVLRSAFPQFAEQSARGGGFAQQDAEECWGAIVSSLRDTVPGKDKEGNWVKPSEGKGWVEEYMTGEMEETSVCTSLVQTIEKNSPTLERNAKYTKKSAISRLPSYLSVQFVRFQWKAQERVRAKILKRVKFPFELDMTPYTTKALGEKLKPGRDYVRKRSDEKEAEKKKAKTGKRDAEGVVKKLEGDSDAMEVEPASKTIDQICDEVGVSKELRDDVGASLTGMYDLVGVVTHLGRTADGGHYIGWVRNGLSDDWFKFDDDKVSPVKSDDILKLEGGGEYHAGELDLSRVHGM